MRLSLIVGLAMLIGKTTIYFMTHSAAIFSDAAESVVHVIVVGFAAFSLRLSTKSASPQFLYGCRTKNSRQAGCNLFGTVD